MREYEIVPSLLEHVDDIMVVERLSFKIPWSRDSIIEEFRSNGFAVYFSALIGGKAIGYGGMWKVFDEGHITNVAVHPEFRGKGIGGALIEILIDEADRSGIKHITLEVRRSNEVARRLYTKNGFKESGVRKAYYADNGEDALIMWKTIEAEDG